MMSSQKISYLSQLKPRRSDWCIQVKAIHTWKQFNATFGESLKIIFADKKGHKIYATFRQNQLISLGSKCVIGEWKIIENMSVTAAKNSLRPTDHMYKISFIGQTKITNCEFVNEDMFLSLVEFETIMSGNLNSSILIDVLGQAMDVGDLQTIQCQNGKERKKIDFTLRDINDQRIACCLWGKFAEMLETHIEEAQRGVVVCLIRFAKIGSFRGVLQISNAYDISQLLINPSIKEACDLKEAFKYDEAKCIVASNEDDNQVLKQDTTIVYQNQSWSEYEDKTIAEMVNSTQIEKCKVVCTVYDIDTDYGWYYFGCKVCNHRTFKVVKSRDTTTPTFWCEKCNKFVSNVSPKFKLHLMLKDDTGTTKFMLLDTIASKIVMEKAKKILNGSLEEIDDSELLPQPIKDIVGKTFKFGVAIENENIAYGVEIYKVLNVWSMNNLLMVGSQSDTISALETTLTSGDVGSFLTDGEESSGVLKTPSSKRSQDDLDDLPDLTSTSKKICSKAIKIEKISEEELKNKNNN
ncbi:hypothetical protein N665_2430s0002 [Sinapis alba]|nr:hypothetical protein N665_2430s0002 [Sinapis alba]